MTTKNKCGIYCIENLTTNRKYIGQSIDILQRFRCHKSNLRNNIHGNNYLQNSWNKYGEADFVFYVLENCNKDCLDELEMYYMNKFDSNNMMFGFNIMGGCEAYRIISQESCKKMSASAEKYPICQIDLNGCLIRRWDSAYEVEAKLGYFRTALSACATKKLNTAYNFVWVYEKDYDEFVFDPLIHKSKGRPILQYSFSKELIHKWKCAEETKIAGFTPSIVSMCAKGKRSNHKGYFWIYEEDENSFKSKALSDILPKRSPIKPIYQIDLNGNVVNEYGSANQAIKDGFFSNEILKVCKGVTQQHKGFYWSFNLPNQKGDEAS